MKNHSPTLLFVYGTLLKGIQHRLSDYLHRKSTFIGNGYFHGKLYDIGGYPGAIISDHAMNKVYGHIFELYTPNKVLAKLDTYEEVGNQFPQPNEYGRNLVDVQAGTALYTCWVYLYNRPVNHMEQITTGDYLNYQTVN